MQEHSDFTRGAAAQQEIVPFGVLLPHVRKLRGSMGHAIEEVLGHLIAGRLHKADRCFPFFVHSSHEATYAQTPPRYWQVGGALKLRALLKPEAVTIRGLGQIDGNGVRYPFYSKRLGGVLDPRKCWCGVWRHEVEQIYPGLQPRDAASQAAINIATSEKSPSADAPAKGAPPAALTPAQNIALARKLLTEEMKADRATYTELPRRAVYERMFGAAHERVLRFKNHEWNVSYHRFREEVYNQARDAAKLPPAKPGARKGVSKLN